MSELSVDSVINSGQTSSAEQMWSAQHPVWARLGALLGRVAVFCGRHAAGYIVPLAVDSDR